MTGNYNPENPYAKRRAGDIPFPATQGDDAAPAAEKAAARGNERTALLTGEDVSAGSWGANLDTLLHELHNLTASATVSPVIGSDIDNQLVQVRLGMAASLFSALRCRDALTAAHALRVALITSAWCLKMNLPGHQRDVIEVAALLHDLGVIAIPDKVLHKSGSLDFKEATVVERSRHIGVEILRAACSEPSLLEIIDNIPTRYDGARPGYGSGEAIPLGSRMIAIVESFDSMTNDHAFRPAMSQESALRELFACAGSQFDSRLVEEFALLQSCDQSAYRREVASRWLHDLDPEIVDSYWELSREVFAKKHNGEASLFETKLINNMHDAVVFVDDALAVTFWNNGAERMTGINESSICGRRWTPDLLSLRDERGRMLKDGDCPVACAVASGVQSLRRLAIQGRNGLLLSVDTHVIPILNDSKASLGAVLLLHDASSETTLEARCQNLHEKSTKDPMTQVGNRAEFDRVHGQFIRAHLQQQRPCSLIICDLDLFKRVNDIYGHQAGDDVIKSLANVLKDSCRAGDLVARYGGEEFVMLCADCDNAAAARRAEQIRNNIGRIPQPRMGGNTVTASFGVTEIQPGDNPETMLRRADRALLTAKARGRNRVVQLGTGSGALAGRSFESNAADDFMPGVDSNTLFEQDMVSSVPIAVAVEKLRGFVADHQARLIDTDGPNVRLEIASQPEDRRRRKSDRPTIFIVDLCFEECQDEIGYSSPDEQPRSSRPTVARLPSTQIHFSITAKKRRDRRDGEVLHQAREVLVSFRSYLMVTDGGQTTAERSISSTRHFWGSWLSERLAPLENENEPNKKTGSFWQFLTGKWNRAK